MILQSKYIEDKDGVKYAPITTPQSVRWGNGDDLNDKLSEKEDVTTIVAPVNTTDATLPITTLTTEIGRYYRIDVPIETLGVTLPAMGVVTSVKTITIYLTGGTTPAVTLSAADSKPVVLQDGYKIKSGKTYEVNCLYNGAAWVVGALIINTGE